jgi:hypothetical protein
MARLLTNVVWGGAPLSSGVIAGNPWRIGMKQIKRARIAALIGLSAAFVLVFVALGNVRKPVRKPLLRVGMSEYDFSKYIYAQTESTKHSWLTRQVFLTRWVDSSHAETFKMFYCRNYCLAFRFQQVEFTNSIVVHLKRARWRVLGVLVQ